jgi:solute carrier family 25 (mitochondrial iron transporter), member 28/37
MEAEFDDYEAIPHSSLAVNMMAGALAGIAEHSLTYPVDSIKV